MSGVNRQRNSNIGAVFWERGSEEDAGGIVEDCGIDDDASI